MEEIIHIRSRRRAPTTSNESTFMKPRFKCPTRNSTSQPPSETNTVSIMLRRTEKTVVQKESSNTLNDPNEKITNLRKFNFNQLCPSGEMTCDSPRKPNYLMKSSFISDNSKPRTPKARSLQRSSHSNPICQYFENSPRRNYVKNEQHGQFSLFAGFKEKYEKSDFDSAFGENKVIEYENEEEEYGFEKGIFEKEIFFFDGKNDSDDNGEDDLLYHGISQLIPHRNSNVASAMNNSMCSNNTNGNAETMEFFNLKAIRKESMDSRGSNILQGMFTPKRQHHQTETQTITDTTKDETMNVHSQNNQSNNQSNNLDMNKNTINTNNTNVNTTPVINNNSSCNNTNNNNQTYKGSPFINVNININNHSTQNNNNIYYANQPNMNFMMNQQLQSQQSQQLFQMQNQNINNVNNFNINRFGVQQPNQNFNMNMNSNQLNINTQNYHSQYQNFQKYFQYQMQNNQMNTYTQQQQQLKPQLQKGFYNQNAQKMNVGVVNQNYNPLQLNTQPIQSLPNRSTINNKHNIRKIHNNQNYLNLSDEELAKQAFSIAKFQSGCRYLQKRMEEKPHLVEKLYFPYVIEYIQELSTDQFGNFYIKKIFNYLSEEKILQFIAIAFPVITIIATNQYGARLLEDFIDFLNTDNLINSFIKVIVPNIQTLINDQNGCHVVHKLLSVDNRQVTYYFLEQITNNISEISITKKGCNFIQKCIEAFHGIKLQLLINALQHSMDTIIVNQYGNYIIQSIFNINEMNIKMGIYREIKSRLCYYANQKYSSNVVEKVFDEHAVLEEMVDEALKDSNFENMLLNNYGNYVAQKIIAKAPEHKLKLIFDKIAVVTPQLQQLPFGQKLLSKLLIQYPKLAIFMLHLGHN
jgi:hypothetical protein